MTSHETLDRYTSVQEEVRNAAKALVAQVKLYRENPKSVIEEFEGPRQK